MLRQFGPLLYWYRIFRDRKSFNREKQHEYFLKKLTAAGTANGKRIMIGVMNFTGTKLQAEMAFIRYLVQKGYSVDVFTCNGECACCSPCAGHARQEVYCGACIFKSHKLEKILKNKVNFIKISDYVSRTEIEEITKHVRSRDFSKREDFVWDGIDMYESVWYGMMRVTLKSYVDVKNNIGQVRKLAVSVFSLASALKKYFEACKPDGCIVSHAMYHLYGPFIDVANHCGITGAYWNGAYMRPHTVYFGLNKNIFTAGICENKKNWQHIKLSAEQKEKLKEQLAWSCPALDESFINKIRKYKKIFGMYTNIPWDGATSNATEAFPDTDTYIAYSLEWFRRNPDCLLIIRSHPYEVKPYARYAEKMQDVINRFDLPENVLFIPPADPIRSFMIADIADASILYGGAMGLELAVAGKTVIQTGNFFWSNKGFVFECKDKNDYYNYLDQVKKSTLKMSNEMIENALVYAWHFIYERHMDIDYLFPDGENGYLPVNDEKLLASSTLTILEEGIINKRDIFFRGM